MPSWVDSPLFHSVRSRLNDVCVKPLRQSGRDKLSVLCRRLHHKTNADAPIENKDHKPGQEAKQNNGDELRPSHGGDTGQIKT